MDWSMGEVKILPEKLAKAQAIGSKFIESYYKRFDQSTVHSDMGGLYMENAIYWWNDECVTGRLDIECFMRTLPPVAHQLDVIEAQPLSVDSVGDDDNPDLKCIAVEINGKAIFHNTPAQKFHQALVLKLVSKQHAQAEEQWLIQSDAYRYVEHQI